MEADMRIALPLLLFAGLLAPGARGIDPAPAAAAPQVKALIDQLGDAKYDRREDAAKKLKAIGRPALPALKEALTSDDPEIVSRARALIRRIEIRPLPQPDPAGVNGIIRARRMNGNFADGTRSVEVTEDGREIKIVDGGDQGITMSVTGLIDGKRGTEEYSAADAAQLKEENPEAYALYERWMGPRGAGLALRGPLRIGGGGGGVVQINGGAFVQFAQPIVPDELEQLHASLRKQMEDGKLKPEERKEVDDGFEKLMTARFAQGGGGMENYLQACDEFRKTLEQYKLDAGTLMPPPAKSRLGVSIANAEGVLRVQAVMEKSRAQRIGLLPGDQIRKVDGKEVADIAGLRKAASAKEKGLVIEVTRDGDDLKLEEKDGK
jgi:hypothetical protein